MKQEEVVIKGTGYQTAFIITFILLLVAIATAVVFGISSMEEAKDVDATRDILNQQDELLRQTISELNNFKDFVEDQKAKPFKQENFPDTDSITSLIDTINQNFNIPRNF